MNIVLNDCEDKNPMTKKIKVFGDWNFIVNGTNVHKNVGAIPKVIQLAVEDSGTTLVFPNDFDVDKLRLVLPYREVPDGAYFTIRFGGLRFGDRPTPVQDYNDIIIEYMRQDGSVVENNLRSMAVTVIYSAALDAWIFEQEFPTISYGADSFMDGWGNNVESLGGIEYQGNQHRFNLVVRLPDGSVVPAFRDRNFGW